MCFGYCLIRLHTAVNEGKQCFFDLCAHAMTLHKKRLLYIFDDMNYTLENRLISHLVAFY